MTIALKEANETIYRLQLLQESKMLEKDYNEYIKEANSIV
jgi:four helix bundle protein